jgi:hypothetical protein
MLIYCSHVLQQPPDHPRPLPLLFHLRKLDPRQHRPELPHRIPKQPHCRIYLFGLGYNLHLLLLSLVHSRYLLDNLLYGRRPQQTPHRRLWPHLFRRACNLRLRVSNHHRLHQRNRLCLGKSQTNTDEQDAITDPATSYERQFAKQPRCFKCIDPSLSRDKSFT